MPGYLTIPEYSAQNISVTPAGNLSSNNIQNALEELDGDLLSGLAEKLGITTASNTYLPIAGGKILQIVRATDATERSTTSTSFVDAGISVTITPQKSDSAIIVIWNAALYASSSGAFVQYTITDASNNALSGAEKRNRSGTTDQVLATTTIGYSTPATTNATTYKGRFLATSGTVWIDNAATRLGQLYAIEVSA